MSKKFYKLYRYVAKDLYPKVIDQAISDIAFWLGDRCCDSQNKICKFIWCILYNVYWFISDIIQSINEKILYLIGKHLYPETEEYKRYSDEFQHYIS